MNRENFVEFLDSEFQKIKETQRVKGRDYSGDADVFFNFKRSAERGGLRPLQVWSVLAGKHWDAIMSYIESDGAAQSEPISGRLHDLEVYCFLMQSYIAELQVSMPLTNLSEAYGAGDFAKMLSDKPIHFMDGEGIVPHNVLGSKRMSNDPTTVTCNDCLNILGGESIIPRRPGDLGYMAMRKDYPEMLPKYRYTHFRLADGLARCTAFQGDDREVSDGSLVDCAVCRKILGFS